MGLVVIMGGLCGDAPRCETQAGKPTPFPTTVHVNQEAERRLADLNIGRWVARQRVTGQSIPSSVKVKEMEIRFVARSLSRMSPIPQDFASDGYWPA